MPNGVSVPTDFPYINITTSNNPDPEYIFIDNRGGNGDPWNVIFDNSGQPVWYSKYPDERRDMKVQHNGVMTMLARDEAATISTASTPTTSKSPNTGPPTVTAGTSMNSRCWRTERISSSASIRKPWT